MGAGPGFCFLLLLLMLLFYIAYLGPYITRSSVVSRGSNVSGAAGCKLVYHYAINSQGTHLCIKLEWPESLFGLPMLSQIRGRHFFYVFPGNLQNTEV